MNQASRAEVASDASPARVIYERIMTIAPAHSSGWWELARLQLASGDVASARKSLSALVETSRDPGLRAMLTAP